MTVLDVLLNFETLILLFKTKTLIFSSCLFHSILLTIFSGRFSISSEPSVLPKILTLPFHYCHLFDAVISYSCVSLKLPNVPLKYHIVASPT